VVETAKVYLVGAGLADTDLLTRKAERVLRSADAVIYDRKVIPQILELANSAARCVVVGSEPSDEEHCAEVCGWYLRLRETCASVVRLLFSDPLIEGEANDELEFLARHGFEIEVIPGVLAETVYECRAAVREATGKVAVR
jgi:uroporphyrin-III C-methyltransferase